MKTWMAAIAVFAGLTVPVWAGESMAWIPEGYRASRWSSVSTGDIEVWVLAREGVPVSRGVARRGETTLEGAAAFQACVVAGNVQQPEELAKLASVLVDRQQREVHAPWLPLKAGDRGPGGAQPPRMDGDVIEYWRLGDQTAAMYRVRVGLDGTVREVVAATELHRPADAAAAFDQEFASKDAAGQAGAIGRFARTAHPLIGPRLAPLTRHESPIIRAAAVDELARLNLPETGPALLAVLLGDPKENLRIAAMRWMVEHPDPAWAPMLEQRADDPYVDEVRRTLRRSARGGCH